MTARAAAWGNTAFDSATASRKQRAWAFRNGGAPNKARTLLGAIIALLLLLAFGAPIGASTTGSGLQARANAIATTITKDNNTLAAIGERYLTEHAAQARAEQQVIADQARISSLGTAIAKERAALAQAAINAYVNGGNNSELGLLLGNDPDAVTTGRAYLGVVEGELSTSMVRYDDERHRLSVESASELDSARIAANEASSSAADRDSVLSTVRTEQALLSSVKGRLAALVAQQAAAQAAAAAAAAAQSAPSQSGPTSPGDRPTVTGAGPPALTAIAIATSAIPSGSLTSAFAGIRNCESGGNYSLNNGNGYYGAYQFSLGTWEAVGGSGLPSAAPAHAQDAGAYALYRRSGFSPWPECAAILGLG